MTTGAITDTSVWREIDPLTDPAWAELHRDGSSLFSSAPWMQAVAETYGLEPRARVLYDSAGSPMAGIAYCEIDDPIGRRIVSFPFSDFQEPLGDLGMAGRLIESLVDKVPVRLRIPADRLPSVDERLFPSVSRALLHHDIDVPPNDSETLFAGLHSQVRQNIRRGRRAGIEVELRGDLEAVRLFYELHVGVRTAKYRLLPQPYSFFEALHRIFGARDELKVALARLDGEVIAGIVYIENGSTLYYKFNASRAEGQSVRPNEPLLWAGMEHCIERGLGAIDLGVSDIDQPGLVRYKRKFTANEQEVVTLSTPNSPSAASAELRATLGHLTSLLTDPRVPPSVAEEAGALLYRYFV